MNDSCENCSNAFDRDYYAFCAHCFEALEDKYRSEKDRADKNFEELQKLYQECQKLVDRLARLVARKQ